jgi:hypothetical protein
MLTNPMGTSLKKNLVGYYLNIILCDQANEAGIELLMSFR